MISSLRGAVVSIRLDGVVLEVGGVGLLVQTTPATLADLRHGAQATLHTTLVVREDSLTLFGFATPDERDVFETLQTVTGVGPRLALAMLAVHEPEQLRRAVAGNDLTALMRVPGVGRKGAQRIVLEIGDRLGAPSTALSGAASASPQDAPAPAPAASAASPVVEALVGLGWNAKQATDAVAAVRGDDAGDVPATELPALLRAALQHLGRR